MAPPFRYHTCPVCGELLTIQIPPPPARVPDSWAGGNEDEIAIEEEARIYDHRSTIMVTILDHLITHTGGDRSRSAAIRHSWRVAFEFTTPAPNQQENS